jgi:hypothetical protein
LDRDHTEEQKRLLDNQQTPVPKWYKWGPYVAERSWGTVREDYSEDGNAWNYFPFEKSHKKTYRWGEDGIAGWCDRYQILVFSPAFWNGKDPILKERLFGLSSQEGNHGEDVKECYYYLDATPTHSYMKYLYKYPQEGFPYELLKTKNANSTTIEPEFEITDTHVFADNRYFDIVIEYAKENPEDLCIRIEIFNRGPESASLHVLPQLWFRNQWSWGETPLPKPHITEGTQSTPCLIADDEAMLSPSNLGFNYHLGKRYLYGMPGGSSLFTDNETAGDDHKYSKDAFHESIIQKKESTNPQKEGTKACFHYFFPDIPSNGSQTLYLRFSPSLLENPLKGIDSIITKRQKEADAFYETIHPLKATKEEKKVQRQALAGMLWSKQFYLFDVNLWLKGDNSHWLPPANHSRIRNIHWRHLNSMRILSMPDKWEYPWFAAWDTAFHCLSLALVDIDFAKEQIWLLLFDQFQHPNGAIPAYEWEFSDLNPPVQAWAAYRLYEMEKEQRGVEDRLFLEKCFLKLLLNFTFWVNKVDSSGCNVFEGGFLGLDNISLIDRSIELAKEGILKQSDGTGWMAMFCLNLMRIALELAKSYPSYETMATKFFQHFVYIADAMKNLGNKQYSMWSEDDGFFYDVLVHPNGNFSRFRVRSLVGLIPLYAVEMISEQELDQFPQMKKDFLWFLNNRKDLTKDCLTYVIKDDQKLYVLSLVNENLLKHILRYVWDPKEFRSSFGLRSLSKFHELHPFSYKNTIVGYEPGNSIERIKGGNSNWRGPIWFPTNYLFLESLKKFSEIFGHTLQISVEGESSVYLDEIIKEFSSALISLFLPNEIGQRPFLGAEFPLIHDPHFKDHLLFYEFYHADTGQGLGASHQTGWSGLVANLIDEYRK